MRSPCLLRRARRAGAALLVASLALLPLARPASGEGSAVAVEAEAGAVSGVARTLSDAGASGGGAVEFGRTGPSPGVTVSGHRFLRNGTPWVPRGLSLIGALSPDNTGAAGEANAHLDETLMRAAKAWGADALRFNVSQRGLDPQDSLHSEAYVERVRRAVSLSRSFGFAVILSVQDQGLGGGNRHPQPSPATVRDWQTLTSMFNDDLEVIYEIFTEPQNKADAAGWAVWRDGGPAVDNLGDPAVGHQAVLDAIRATGSRNLVLADGAQYGHNLEGMPGLSDPLGRVGYAIHPYISSVTRDPANWDAAFGDAAATIPVLNTAWNAHSESGSCDADWPRKAALLVDYMEARDIGQFGWGFDFPGTLIRDWDFTPTNFDGFTCGVEGQGAGELIRDHFLAAGEVPGGCPSLPANEGEVSVAVDVAVAGRYVVWSRLRAPDAASGGYWLQVDAGCPTAVGDGVAPTGAWAWESGPTLDLFAGKHTVSMIGRFGGVALDRILLVADDCVPSGTGDTCAAPSPTSSSTTSSSTTSSSTTSSTTTTSTTTTSTTTTSTSTTTTSTTPPTTAPPPAPGIRSFSPVADASVEEANPTRNSGASARLRMDGGADPDVETYLRFDPSELTGPVISAHLRLTVSNGTANGPKILATSNGWSESTITFANRPPRSGAVLADAASVAKGATAEWDVTDLVRTTVNDPVSFVLVPDSSDGLEANSKEAPSNRPVLVVTTGTPAAGPLSGLASTPTGRGYWTVGADGKVSAFGDARHLGDASATIRSRPVIGIAATPSGRGYWLADSGGRVFAFGDAPHRGDTAALTLNRPVVGIAATPSGLGYWMVATDGGIFAFGDARFAGSMGGHQLNRPMVGMAADPDGTGYWTVASDGGIFSFDAEFSGSTGSIRLNRPIVGMAPTAGGRGYWLVASDGGIFAFDAPFFGSTGGRPPAHPVVGMAATPAGDGYWLATSGAQVFAFGSAS